MPARVRTGQIDHRARAPRDAGRPAGHSLLIRIAVAAALAGCASGGATGATPPDPRPAAADADAARAARALARGKSAKAIFHAERAALAHPGDVAVRALLARSYLRAGRFAAAREAYADLLTLSPGDGQAARNLALAQIAAGDAFAARRTLDAHAAVIPLADRGLALALAGDAAGGVVLLDAAARAPGADATTRQNLALALALAGRWPEAHAIATMDLAPAEADRRVVQWMAFATPRHPAEQVAAILGVSPVADPGRPAALAIVPPPPVATALAPAPVLAAVPAHAVRFAAPRAVVQATSTPPVEPRALRSWTGASAAKPAATGGWYVQIGAYPSAALAQQAWDRVRHRFAGRAPLEAVARVGGTRHHRLSVGGMPRSAANAACVAYRRGGGSCFVRGLAGDRTASWAGGGTAMAAR